MLLVLGGLELLAFLVIVIGIAHLRGLILALHTRQAGLESEWTNLVAALNGEQSISVAGLTQEEIDAFKDTPQS